MPRSSSRELLPPLLAVRAFEAAARRLSFSLAAQDLHVTQSAVSRQVRLLEDFLGYRLFVRLTRSVALTPQGEDFFRAAQQSLDILETATRRGRESGGRCTLKISITQSLAFEYVLPRLPAFSAAWPDIEVRVLTSTAPADFQSDEFDAAIRLGPFPGKRYLRNQPRIPHELVRSWNGVAAFQLWDEVLTPVVSHRLIAPRPTAWSDWFRSRGETLPAKVVTSDFGHFFMTLDAARAGRGVALVPTLFLRSLDPLSDLFCPFASNVPSAGEYYFHCREETAARGPVEALIAWLQADAREFADATVQFPPR
jgi:LysR family glycine cleavage system transcriptional activator